MKLKTTLFNFEAKWNITIEALPFNWPKILWFKSGIQIKIQQNWICIIAIAYYIKLKL